MSKLAPGVSEQVAFLHGKTLEDLLSGRVTLPDEPLDHVADVRWQDIELDTSDGSGQFTIRRFEPHASTAAVPVPRPAIVWAHGGAWIAGGIETAEGHLVPAELCHKLDAIVYSVGYRLAPAHTYPAAMDDVISAFDAAVADDGVDSHRIILGGASAGGNLAASACQVLRDRRQQETQQSEHSQPLSEKSVQPCASFLVYPATSPIDGPYEGERPPECPELLWFDQTLASLGFSLYLAGADPRDDDAVRYAQPATGPLHDLPATLVTTSAIDALETQAVHYVELLRAAGCEATHHQVQGVLHGYLGHFNEIDASLEAMERHITWLGEKLYPASVMKSVMKKEQI